MLVSTSAASALHAFPAHAHDGQPLAPHDLWSAWSFEPVVVGALAIAGWLYLRGARAVWRSAGAGRGVQAWEAWAFGAGWLLLLASLISPLHRVGEVLFSAHMAQHELLMAAAAPLLVLSRPLVAFIWAVPPSWRRSLGRVAAFGLVRDVWENVTSPHVTWILHALAIWLWHVPALYQLSVTSDTVHTLQHSSFLGTGLLFWWSLLRGREGRIGRPIALVYLFITAVHTSILGALLTFSTRVWYPLYDSTTVPWGLTPLEDQQLAGVIMWVPGGLAYLIAALAIAASWLDEREPRMIRA
ncbi:MAG TPA: cytochrome c oxidase assembly protein [Gemmatimonadales bacterium]|nr:cytochrome c oxidase assembly protein [Gemmatimonadales bacterium]